MSASTWTDVLQTVAVVAALVFTGWEIRARRREQRFRNYLDGMAGFVDLAKLMVEKPDLHGIYDYSDRNIDGDYGGLTPEQRARVHYCDAVIAVCETIWLASEEGWLSNDEWPYWQEWAHQLMQSSEFRWTLNWVKDDYDARFLATLVPPMSRMNEPQPNKGCRAMLKRG
ncbi:MAG TPA: hypothetical protein PK468_17275 [Candidatus Hydrogenedentes bacterium]|nr:hypothetical protein [Candidatus Hydrogenedentota bacterium]